MDDLLDRIEAAAGARPLGATDSELQSCANLAKTIVDARKTRVDVQSQARSIRLEYLKSWSMMLVPIVSMLTLLGTVIVQGYQLRQQTKMSVQQGEDANWKELISSLRTAPETYASDITVSSRLIEFLDSARYKNQARHLAIRVMGTPISVNTFKELFHAVMSAANTGDLEAATETARILAPLQRTNDSRCHELGLLMTFEDKSRLADRLYFGVCETSLSEAEVEELVSKDTHQDLKNVLSFRRSYLAGLEEVEFVSGYIVEALHRAHSSEATKARPVGVVDLSGAILRGVDLSGVDFSSFIVSNSAFDYDNLRNARITPRRFDGVDLSTSNWWDADLIDANLLAVLIATSYPYYSDRIKSYPSGDISNPDYQTRVKTLCQRVRADCHPPFKFGNQAEPEGRPKPTGP